MNDFTRIAMAVVELKLACEKWDSCSTTVIEACEFIDSAIQAYLQARHLQARQEPQ